MGIMFVCVHKCFKKTTKGRKVQLTEMSANGVREREGKVMAALKVKSVSVYTKES